MWRVRCTIELAMWLPAVILFSFALVAATSSVGPVPRPTPWCVRYLCYSSSCVLLYSLLHFILRVFVFSFRLIFFIVMPANHWFDLRNTELVGSYWLLGSPARRNFKNLKSSTDRPVPERLLEFWHTRIVRLRRHFIHSNSSLWFFFSSANKF